MALLSNRSLTALLVVLAAVIAVYANSLPNEFTFDDHPIVENNPVLAQGSLLDILSTPFWPGQPELGLYRPVTLLSYAANYQVHGTRVLGYRITNLLLHALVGWVLYLVIARWFGHSSGLASALIFVTHPLHSESVNAIVGRAELLACGFLLLAWYANLRASGDEKTWQAVSIAAYALACLSKEHAIVFPAFLVAEDIWLHQDGGLMARVRETIRRLPGLMPYAAVMLCVLLLRVQIIGSLTLPAPPDFVDNPLAHTDLITRAWSAIAILARYIVLMLAPVDLSVDYTYNVIPASHSFTDPYLISGFGVFAAMLSLAYRSSNGEAGGVFGLGCIVLLVAWLPISNLFFAIGTPMNERLMYMPSIGFAILVGAGYGRLDASMKAYPAWILAAVVCVVLGGRTIIRNADWRNDFTLFASAVQVSDSSAKAWFNLGNALRDDENTSGALDAYAKAIEIYPGYAEVYYNRGVVYTQRGNLTAAAAAYRSAIQRDEHHVSALVNLGITLARLGETDKAIPALKQASELASSRADVFYNLGIVLEDSDREGAIQAYREALRLRAGYEDAAVNLSLLYMQNGDTERATAVLGDCLAVNGKADRAAYNLAVEMERAERFEDAIGRYRLAWIQRSEAGVFSRYRMGLLFGRTGKIDSARTALQEFVANWKGDPTRREDALRLLDELQGKRSKGMLLK